ncbi:hypothetical protein [Aureispira sp. CCB-E]|uniref:hypothetical protein n=1 Tax=Aureispira sp. CCB-E TaxID=3051121 RepID=UPI0028684AA4|nr:hypothetical protein [Aureispira sp. CCB-E]WMX15193.1 hypothetical protein QP953_02265 [Aureispira sp. CCB-E]
MLKIKVDKLLKYTIMRLLTALVFLLFLNIACTSEPQTDQSTPEAAAKGFFEALKAEDFEKAKLYGTKSTQESLRDFATNLKMINAEEKEELIAPYKMEVSKVTCAEKSGTTICQLCCNPEFDVELTMVQQDEKWFAQMDFPY